MTLRRICVFAGSSLGRSEGFARAAHELGECLALEGIGLVYGGGNVGLMGVVADAALGKGGEAIGVIPRALADLEVAHTGLTRLEVVATMHERKAAMADLADAFIALPGGIGTLEELFEIWTWTQLGVHRKAAGLLNVEGFYDGLAGFVDQLVDDGFVKRAHRDIVFSDGDPRRLVARLRAYEPPSVAKLLDPERR
ncbi:MAG: TIGR00730 family Rossman fold protein [Gammaproteobacteria bacterium]|nr:TIGR00730 family Rossman fold protein [Gammaproteobacteria bacterium]